MIENQCRNPLPALEIDYAKSTCLVYQDMTKHFSNTYGSLALLEVFYVAKCEPDWPSWTLDLRLDVDAQYLRADLDITREWRNEQLSVGVAVQDLKRVGQLVLQGTEMGRVSNRAGSSLDINDIASLEKSRVHAQRPSFIHLVRNGAFLARNLRIGSFETSRLGVCASEAAREGDLVILLIGSDCPFILREIPHKPSHYTLVGACWLWYLVDSGRDSLRRHSFNVDWWLTKMRMLLKSEPLSHPSSRYARLAIKGILRRKNTLVGPLDSEPPEVGRALIELHLSLNPKNSKSLGNPLENVKSKREFVLV